MSKRFSFFKKRRKLTIGIILIVVISVIVTGGCIQQVSPNGEKVRIAYLRGDLHHLPFFVALDQGWYEEAGLEVETPEFENGMQEMLGFSSGEVDVGYLGVAPALVQFLNAQIHITVVAGVNQEGSGIIVGANSEIQSVADLAGKKFAIPGIGTVQHFLALMALEQHGLSRSDLYEANFIETSVINMEPALQKGGANEGIDAFLAWEPFNAKAVDNGIGRYLIRSGEIWPDHPCCVVSARTEFLEAHPEIVQKIVNIHARTTNWIREHPSEAVSIFRKYADLSQDAVELAMENIDYIKAPNINEIKQYLEKLIDYGIISADNTPADIDTFLAKFINGAFLEEALKVYP